MFILQVLMHRWFRHRRMLAEVALRLNKEHLKTLGLDPSKQVSAAEIKQAYAKMVKLHHPDVSKSKNATQRFQEIQKAKDELLDETNNPHKYTNNHSDVHRQGSSNSSSTWQHPQANANSTAQSNRDYTYGYYQSYQERDDQYTNSRGSRYHEGRRTRYGRGYREDTYYRYYNYDAGKQDTRVVTQNSSSVFIMVIFTYMILSLIFSEPKQQPQVVYVQKPNALRHHAQPAFIGIKGDETLDEFMNRRAIELKSVQQATEVQCIQYGMHNMIQFERLKHLKMPDNMARVAYGELQSKRKTGFPPKH